MNGGYYHVFNRGVDKRAVFMEQRDLERFFQSMDEFNTIEPIGSIYENSFYKDKLKKFGNLVSKEGKLVDFVCYCLNPNHYHFFLKQLVDRGIEKFMHRVGIGYTKYFNQKYKRSGSLFQGVFKAVNVDSNEYLLHLSVYINLNYKVHKFDSFGNLVSKLTKSSWDEYIKNGNSKNSFCEKNIILDQFENALEYRKFAEDSLGGIKEKKEIERFLLE